MLSRYTTTPGSRWRSYLLALGLGLTALARPAQAQTLRGTEVPTISGGAAATMHVGPTIDAVLARPEAQATIVKPLRTKALRTIEAINFNGSATNSGFYNIPPDPSGAAGPNHVVNVVNTSIEWFRKSDGVREQSVRLGKNSTTDVGSFFEPLHPETGTFDPKVIYDQYENRFVVITLDRTDAGANNPSNTSRIMLAVSDDDDPNGTWFYYSINALTTVGANATWGDYPGLAIDDAAIYVTANLFTFGTSGTYQGSRLWILGKGTAGGFYGGLPASSAVYDPGTAVGQGGSANSGFNFTLQPAHFFGANPIPGGGTFLVAYNGLSDGTNEFLAVYTVTNPLAPGGAAFSLQTVNIGNVDNTGAGTPATLFGATQLGSSNRVDMGGRRMQNAVWRANTLYATTQVNSNVAADAGQSTSILAKMNTTTLAAIVSTGNTLFGGEDLGAGAYTGYPNVAVDATGRALVGLAASGPTFYPGAFYAVVPAGSNTAGPTQTLQAGLAPYFRAFGGTRNRWGDYTGSSVDPTDGSFWLYNEYSSSNGTVLGQYPTESGRWATLHGNIKFNAVLAVTTQPATAITTSGATLNATVNPNGASATVTFRYGTVLGTYTNSVVVPAPVTGTTDQAVSAAVTGLAGATTYYFVAEITDGITTVVGQPRSFSTLQPQGIAQVLPNKVTATVAPGGVITRTLTVRNIGTDPLTFTVKQLTTTSAPGSVGVDPNKTVPLPVGDPEKGEPDLRPGIDPDASGGPDAGGYRWVDSDNTGGPAVDFVDISTVGTQLTSFTKDDPATSDTATDEGYATTTLPFAFPFYGVTKASGSTFRASTNGFLTFGSTGTVAYSNQSIPRTAVPNDVIAPFWDDLELGANGKIYTYNDVANNRFIVEYQNVQLFGAPTTSFTFEAILSPDGTVVFQYGTMTGTTTSATVGIENAGGTVATRVVFNAAYVKSNLATRISTVAPTTFITGADPLSGTVQPGETKTIVMTLRAGSLAAGTYSQSFAIATNGVNQAVISRPVFLTVTPTPTPGTTYTADTPGAYVLETLFFEATALPTPGALTVVPVPGPVTGPKAPPISALSQVRRYDITFTGVGTFDLTFPYGDEGITDPATLRIARRETSGDTWTVYPTFALNTTDQTITATGVTSFSQWALATVGADVPLAVELRTFAGAPDDKGVTLSWNTATEQQNAGFSVLRAELIGGTVGAYATVAQHTTTPSLVGQGTTAQAHSYTWRDERVAVGHTYRYTLLSTDVSGATHRYTQSVEVLIPQPAAAVALPTEFALLPASPNPFNPTTSLRLDLPQASTVTAEVYTTLGQRVRVIAAAVPMVAGQQRLTMDGAGLASGVYVVRVIALGENGVTFSKAQRVLLTK